MKLLYQGVDIYPDISVSRCYHEMYAAGHSDTLTLRLNDTRELWDIWDPQEGDEIEVQLGAATTGKMFVKGVTPESGGYQLRAFSMPPSALEPRSKSWEQVKFLQLCEEIAERNGLGFENYGVTDQIYSYVSQANQDDAHFLHLRCKLEGAAFLVHDGQLVVYDERHLEEQEPVKTITVGAPSEFEYTDNSGTAYGSIEMTNGTMQAVYSVGDGPVLKKACPVFVSDDDEAERFAMNLLRNANKMLAVGEISCSTMMEELAAGSLISLETASAPSWSGPAFVYRQRNEYADGVSKLFVRRPLEGY